MRIVDLSVPIDARTPFYPGDPEPQVCVASTIARDGFAVSALRLGSHSGTHVDAPSHFHPDGATLDEVPLERFAGPAVVVDCTAAGPRERIGAEVLEGHDLRPGAVVLFRTGHDGDAFDHPFLDPAVARALLDAGVLTLGIDALNVDPTPREDAGRDAFPVHDVFLGAGGVIAENLRNLDALPHGTFVTLLPLSLPGCDGGPTRAVGFVGEDAPHHG